MKKVWLSALGAISLMACNNKVEDNTPVEKYSVHSDYMDTAVRPNEDFFKYANATWVKNHPVPSTEKRWGSFNELDSLNKEQLKTILSNLLEEKGTEKGSTKQLVGDFYASYLNMEARDAKGVAPIQGMLQGIDKVSSLEELAGKVAEMHDLGIGVFFSYGVEQDLKNPDVYAMYFGQSGLGLPNKNYYKDEDKESIRQEYVAFGEKAIAAMATTESASNVMANAYKVEMALADISWDPVELRDIKRMYNPMAFTDMDKESELDFNAYMAGLSYFDKDVDTVIVTQTDYLQNLNGVFTSFSVETLKDYLKWSLMNHYIGSLTAELNQMNFDFYSGVLSGVKEMKPDWKRGIDRITGSPLGESLGKLYVEKHFSPEAKDAVNKMVDNIFAAFRVRLNGITWMSEETKKKAIVKLESFDRKLGYPDKWKDMSSLDITEDYFQNTLNMTAFITKENFDKFGKEVDKSEWGMPAHMVNAYYNPLNNEIVFPAAIMQPPFFDINAEDALNYGGMGMVIGHEFTHGFDDQGAQFGPDGSLSNWWTEEDAAEFKKRTDILGETYAHFCPFEGVCVNPGLTMGENIADLGGLTLSYYAYMMTEDAKAGDRDGFTPEQRFFIAYAQLWKINYTDEFLKQQIETDPHSPGMYRVNGPLMNLPEFFTAFSVLDGEPMRNPEEKIAKIW